MAKVEMVEVIPQDRKRSRGIRWRPVLEGATKSQSQASYLNSHARSKSVQPPPSLSVARPPDATWSESLAARVAKVLDLTVGTGHDILLFGEWLPDLTARIGNNGTLDAAVEALLISHQNVLMNTPDRDDAGQVQAYGRALQALKADISVDQRTIGAETICAALALCSVEVRIPNLKARAMLTSSRSAKF